MAPRMSFARARTPGAPEGGTAMEMDLGMCMEEIRRPTIEEAFDAVRGYGIRAIQFNCLAFCDEELPPPERIDQGEMARIGRLARERGLDIVAMNGTVNMIEADPAALEENLRRFEGIAGACGALGCDLVTLCTGSRNPYSRWWDHPYNHTPEAWERCKATAARMAAIAERYDVRLGIETEVTTVVSTPELARRFLDEMGSPRIRIVLDLANMVDEGEATTDQVDAIMDRAFQFLGKDIALAHAKDIKGEGRIHHTSAGNGIIDFGRFFRKLREAGYGGPMVMHRLARESEFPGCVAFLRRAMASVD